MIENQLAESSVDRFAVKSRARTILLFALGYSVFQPVMQLFLRIFGEGLAFQSVETWVKFELVMAGIGAAVGAVWFSVQRRPPSWTREWVDNSLRMIAFGCIIGARQMFTKPQLVWVIAVLIASVLLGALWTVVSRAAGGESTGGRLTSA
jgi:hypothetical protein